MSLIPHKDSNESDDIPRSSSEDDITKPEFVRKSRGPRATFTPKQIAYLEEKYDENQMPTEEEKMEIAEYLELSKKQVQIWFQNRRVREGKRYGPSRKPPPTPTLKVPQPVTTRRPETQKRPKKVAKWVNRSGKSPSPASSTETSQQSVSPDPPTTPHRGRDTCSQREPIERSSSRSRSPVGRIEPRAEVSGPSGVLRPNLVYSDDQDEGIDLPVIGVPYPTFRPFQVEHDDSDSNEEPLNLSTDSQK